MKGDDLRSHDTDTRVRLAVRQQCVTLNNRAVNFTIACLFVAGLCTADREQYWLAMTPWAGLEMGNGQNYNRIELTGGRSETVNLDTYREW